MINFGTEKNDFFYRRSMQTTMTEIGMVEWLIRLLENTENLSDYTLEYAVALFMNLCLRTAGRKTATMFIL